MGLLAVVSSEPVQEELGLVEEQVSKINDLRREMRGGRGGRGGRDGERPNFRDMTDEERQEWMAERQKEAAERAKQEKEKLGEILMDHQTKRLEEISLQLRGVSALQDPEVAKQIGLSEEDQEELRDTIREESQKMREEMRDLFGSGDRDQIREKMTEMQKKMEDEVMAVLSSEQKEKFVEMKGESFDKLDEVRQARFGGGRGGDGGPRGRGGEGRPDRPRRPAGDDAV